MKQGREKTTEATVSVPITPYVMAKLKRDQPITISIDITLEADGYDGVLRVRAYLAPPRVKRRRASTRPDASDAG